MQGKRKGAGSAAKAGKGKPKAASAKKKTSAKGSKAQGQERLRPGQLDGLVLGYMKKRKGELPITPTKVARGIKRSSGAVGNCLGRLEKEEKVRLTARSRAATTLPTASSSKKLKKRPPAALVTPTEGLTTRRLMADEKSTDPGVARRFQFNHEEDDALEVAVLRRVLEFHPDAFTGEELLREMIFGGSTEFSEVDAHERALRDLAAAGLLHPLGDEGFVRPTRAALRFFELSGGAG